MQASASAWRSSRASPKHTTGPSPSLPGTPAGSASRCNYHGAFATARTVWVQVLGTGSGLLRPAQGISRKRSRRAPRTHRSTAAWSPPASVGRLLLDDIRRRLVVAQAKEAGLPEPPLGRPFGEADLRDELRSRPVGAAGNRPRVGER